MIRLLLVVILMLTHDAYSSDGNSELRRAKYQGAHAKVVLRCVDQDGNTVSNAHVSSGFTPDGSFERAVACNGTTDKNGLYAVIGKSNGELMYAITKRGYYRTQSQEFLYNHPAVFVCDGRWEPYGLTNTVILKRKVNPVAMCVKWNSLRDIFPSKGVFYGYDLAVGDWVEPFGKGNVADFHACYERRGGTKYLDVASVLTLLFTNTMDGVYSFKKDMTGSLMNTAMRANTSAVYDKKIVFSYKRTPHKVITNTYMTATDYLVLRTRTECDEDGKLKKAHYAKIVGKLEVARGDKLDFVYYFNPNVNDPNLEADTTRNLLNPRDLGFPP